MLFDRKHALTISMVPQKFSGIESFYSFDLYFGISYRYIYGVPEIVICVLTAHEAWFEFFQRDR